MSFLQGSLSGVVAHPSLGVGAVLVVKSRRRLGGWRQDFVVVGERESPDGMALRRWLDVAR